MQAYQCALLEKPVLLNSRLCIRIICVRHIRNLSIYLIPWPRVQHVILTEEVQKILSELMAFVQQDLEIDLRRSYQSEPVAELRGYSGGSKAVATSSLDLAQI